MKIESLYSQYCATCNEIISSKDKIMKDIKFEIESDVSRLIDAEDLSFTTLNKYFDDLHARLLEIENSADEIIKAKLLVETKNYSDAQYNLLVSDINDFNFATFASEAIDYAIDEIQHSADIDISDDSLLEIPLNKEVTIQTFNEEISRLEEEIEHVEEVIPDPVVASQVVDSFEKEIKNIEAEIKNVELELLNEEAQIQNEDKPQTTKSMQIDSQAEQIADEIDLLTEMFINGSKPEIHKKQLLQKDFQDTDTIQTQETIELGEIIFEEYSNINDDTLDLVSGEDSLTIESLLSEIESII